jgi:hypothetical protein
MMRSGTIFAILPLLPGLLRAQDAAEIMGKVATNVEKSADDRKQFVYHQFVRSSLNRGNGEVARREKREYAAIPTETRTEKKLDSFSGEYRKGKQMIPYSDPSFRAKGTDIDGDLIGDLSDGLVNDKKSRDGIPRGLFPLDPTTISRYHFSMAGETTYQGRGVWKIAFTPIEKENCLHIGSDEGDECENAPWKGEAWIDREELQPVRIETHLAFNIPWGVRVFLGTNLKQTGFSITYIRVAENVWFPATYGTEFWINVLWGYRRSIILSMESSGFRKTDVKSAIQFSDPK